MRYNRRTDDGGWCGIVCLIAMAFGVAAAVVSKLMQWAF